ncbi:hypothetical protein SAMN04489724_3906 [Algoriphagus locisalis]|uniref:Uncharacterized protein n=1 Tax=Algoriphagus locisalis TaxID=305507 RepID=A0A1I7DD41_9BACT|nr:hypothetical protein [Algoriphagus locisalis]SFU09525.1 hypothetical protein SAMN04489724_3906 [Algoriphagus locisalis]
MKHHKSFSFGIILIVLFGFSSCVDEISNNMETDPYFDLKGFIEEHIQKVDKAEVTKTSQIQGEEKEVEVIYSKKDWEEELSIFKDADINKASMLQSYKTSKSDDLLVHEALPKSKEKVKYIKVTYENGAVSSVSIKIADDNLFYASTTLAEIHINSSTKLMEHYSIQTSQKIWFLDENNMKIQGKIVP